MGKRKSQKTKKKELRYGYITHWFIDLAGIDILSWGGGRKPLWHDWSCKQ
jgi:hypothetical protein